MSTQFLTVTQEDFLAQLDNLIDFHKQQNKPLNKIQITKKQKSMLDRLIKMQENGEIYGRKGKIPLKGNLYNGIPIEVVQPLRKRYNKKRLDDMFE